jgi:ABC-2 type transport system permease protein
MIFAIAAKELKSLFASPLAWVVLALLELVIAYLFLSQIDAFDAVQSRLSQLANAPGITEVIVAPLFGSVATVLLMAVPLLSMRLLAEEKRNRTLTLLISAPLAMTEIVLGKFLGLLLFLAAVIALPALMALSLYAGGTLDSGLLLANLLGALLLAASFASLGLFVSSLTAQPVVAAMGTLGALLGLWIVNLATAEPDSVLHYLSVMKHFESFNKGLVNTGDIAYFALFTLTFLVLTVRRLDRDRLGA